MKKRPPLQHALHPLMRSCLMDFSLKTAKLKDVPLSHGKGRQENVYVVFWAYPGSNKGKDMCQYLISYA